MLYTHEDISHESDNVAQELFKKPKESTHVIHVHV